MIGDLLREKTDAIVERWGEAVLSAYAPDAAVLFKKQRDPFANPIGHSVREGTRGVFEAMLGGMDGDEIRSHLDAIVRVRAVQELSASQALGFVFALRSIVREVVPELEADPRLRREGAELDRKIDEVALMAFELYAERREEVSRLRVNEMKRQVGWVLEKVQRREARWREGQDESARASSGSENVQTEDLR